jgi:signal transduction histidine kinase
MKITSLLESGNSKLRILIGWAGLIALILVLMSIYMWTIYQQVKTSARIEAEVASKMVALNFSERVQHLDDILLHTKDSFDRYGPGLTQRDTLFKTKRDADELPYKNIVIINSTGDTILSLPPMLNLREFTHIAELASERDDDMPFSSVVLDNDVPFFIRAVPLRFDDGTFAGAVLGEFDRSWLQQTLVDVCNAYGLIINAYFFEINLASSSILFDSSSSERVNMSGGISLANSDVNFETYIDKSIFNQRWRGAFGYLSLSILIAILGLTVGAVLLESSIANHLKGIVTAQVENNSTLLKSRFLANMSHELRTPMSGILGATELLFDTKLSLVQSEFLVLIERSGQHMLSILNDILDVSKIDAQSLILDIKEVSPFKLVDDIVQMMKVKAYLKGLSLYSQINIPSEVIARFDGFRVTQVVTNLLGNAIKFTSTGHVRVIASISNSEKGLNLIVSIEDTGVGISDEARANLFQLFHQTDVSDSRKYGGGGLGLIISKKLVQLMGGGIEVSSKIKLGSVFQVEIPISMQSFPENLTGSSDIYPCVYLKFNDKILKESIEIHLHNLNAPYLELDASENSYSNECVLISDHIPVNSFSLFGGRYIQIENFISNILNDSDVELANIDFKKNVKLVEPIRRGDLASALLKFGSRSINPTSDYVFSDDIGRSTLKGASVLIAEDTLINQKILQVFLESLGCKSTFVLDGQEAIDAISKQLFDVVIMDCHMPNVDGFEATRRIRQIEAMRQGGKHTPIIALTAAVSESDKLKCKEAGMDDFCGKPISRKLLQEKLERWIV